MAASGFAVSCLWNYPPGSLAPALGPVPLAWHARRRNHHHTVSGINAWKLHGSPIRQTDDGLPPLEGHA